MFKKIELKMFGFESKKRFTERVGDSKKVSNLLELSYFSSSYSFYRALSELSQNVLQNYQLKTSDDFLLGVSVSSVFANT